LGFQDVENLHFYAEIDKFTMSVEIYPKVLELDMDARRKLILAVLAEHANKDGLCWPSQALIARHASISIRKLRVHLRGLENEGLLRTFVNKGPREVNYYLLNVAKIAEAARLITQLITEEKERNRAKFTDGHLVTPDFADITPDFADNAPDFQSIHSGPQGPTEPSKKRKVTAKEPTDYPKWFQPLTVLKGFKFIHHKNAIQSIRDGCDEAGVNEAEIVLGFADYYRDGGRAINGWSDPVASLVRTLPVQINKTRKPVNRPPPKVFSVNSTDFKAMQAAQDARKAGGPPL
jgi:DNA-binding transcriptional ArsR family regulator